MNILTFDIEEWSIEKEFLGGRKDKYAQFDRLLDHILERLNAHNTKATFFCLGKIAVDFPDVINKISAEGHEIGSHSFSHKWINKMTIEEFREDTRQAVTAIEDLTGRKVKSFRAPAFSIGEDNKWAFEILSEFGIENDASIFPGARDYGGFPNFTEEKPCIIEHKGCKINEFPIPLYTLQILNKQIAYSGGGYFRLLPFSFVLKKMKETNYNMWYFHIDDLLTEKLPFMNRIDFEEYYKESGTIQRRLIRYFKTNVGRSKALKHLDKLVDSVLFKSIPEYLSTNQLHNTISI